MTITKLKPLASAGLLMVAICCTAAPTMSSAFAQVKTDTNMQIMRDKVKADKKLLVATNMELTEAEATKFWPIYEAYQRDLQVVNDRLSKTILSYADAYNNKTLTDATAKTLSDEAISVEEDEARLRRTYSVKLYQAIPAKKAARYLQIEKKIRAALHYEMADGIPLVP